MPVAPIFGRETHYRNSRLTLLTIFAMRDGSGVYPVYSCGLINSSLAGWPVCQGVGILTACIVLMNRVFMEVSVYSTEYSSFSNSRSQYPLPETNHTSVITPCATLMW